MSIVLYCNDPRYMSHVTIPIKWETPIGVTRGMSAFHAKIQCLLLVRQNIILLLYSKRLDDMYSVYK